MTASDITRVTTTTNATVVQLPERKYPGVVIQGDSLENLRNLVRDAQRQIEDGDSHECRSILDELDEILEGYLASYREAMAAVGPQNAQD